MSDAKKSTHEMLGVFDAALESDRSCSELGCATSRAHAIVLTLLAALVCEFGGCGGGPSPSMASPPPDGGPDTPPPPMPCHGAQPSPTAAKACGCDADCDLGESCIDEALSGFPGGYCFRSCDLAPCPDGFVCEQLTSGDRETQACLPRCTTSADCRQGYLCAEFANGNTNDAGQPIEDTVCSPHCSSSADCPTAMVCDPYYGLCGLQPHPGTGDIGDACAKNEDCISNDCIVGPAFPNGYCTATCSIVTPDCPAGFACEFSGDGVGDEGKCLKGCAQDSDCRADYSCVAGELYGASVCLAPFGALTVAMSGTGSGTVNGDAISCGATCEEIVSLGKVVTLTAVAADGSAFAGWSGCDAPDGATCMMTLDAVKTAFAFFELVASPSTLTVTRSGNGSGTVTATANGIACGSDCSATAANGSSIVLTAVPATGASFTGWTGCDAPAGATCTMSMTASKTVTAIFDGNCTPDATRCVSGDITLLERCGAAGTWTQESCNPWTACAADTCRAVCGMPSIPADPTLCFLPIADGVNDGTWRYWNDPNVKSPDFVTAEATTRSGEPAEILPAPGQDWPFMWRLRASDFTATYFGLDQFGPYRHPALGYRAQRAGVQPANAGGFIGTSFGIYATPSIGSCTSQIASTWTADTCSVVTPLNQAFDYTGGANEMLLSVYAPFRGGVLDLLDLNYTYLTIAP